MNAVGNAFHAFRAVVNGIHTGQVRQQCLCGTNIGCRFFAADVLLAGGQSHAQGRFARCVFGYADDAARSGTFELIFKREISSVRPAEAHWYAEALGVAQSNIRAQLGRRFQQNQTHDVGGNGHDCAFGFQTADNVLQVLYVAVFADVLEQRAEVFAFICFSKIADHQLEAKIFGAGFHHVQSLRIHARIHKETLGFYLAHAVRHRHRFGGGGRFVQQRRACHRETGQIDTHLLEVQQRLQTTLRDFRLIRRVGGVPARIFQYVAQNHVRHAGRVIAQADIGFVDYVFRRNAFQFRQSVRLGQGFGQVEFGRHTDALRHGVADKIVHALLTERFQKRSLVAKAQMTRGKFVRVE